MGIDRSAIIEKFQLHDGDVGSHPLEDRRELHAHRTGAQHDP